ncbi:MAG: hypothetical protein H0T53_18105 [Herpetosiphonaceae bacterium]|nr:hypothetical protein [Herpetosiphonaceae bacterium]
MTDSKQPQEQPEHPSQAEGDRSTGGPGAETAAPARQGQSDPSRERPSQAEGERDSGERQGG